MKKTSLLLLLVLMTIMFKALAERINIPGLGIPKLIITEVRPDAEATAYIEITNMGDTAIDLAPFTIHSVYYNTRITEISDSIIKFNRGNPETDGTLGKVYLKGVLQPGESYVVSSVWDADNVRHNGIPNHNTAIAQIGKQFVHKVETANTLGWINKPIWQCFGKDSVSVRVQTLNAMSSAGYLIHWKYTNSLGVMDSTYIDEFNMFFSPYIRGYTMPSIAGISDAMTASIMVRKSSITKGNMNWNQSRGTDVLTSEWLVIPKNTSRNMAFTSAGNHGVYNLDYTVKDPSKVILNEAAKTISVPWNTVRGDSLARYFNLGKGMGWSYTQNAIFADSASYISRLGDKFALYAVGNELLKSEFTLQVRDADPNIALVFPRKTLNPVTILVLNPVTNVNDTVYTYRWSTGFRYAISEGVGIDSLINIPFATRKDSLLKYLDKPEKAKWEIIPVDGQNRVDLKFGDKIKVTSENNAKVKEYFLAVSDYVRGNNALLRTVTWPDIDHTQYPRWNVGDTLAEFTPLKTQYVVDLAYNAKNIPAFQFKTEDIRARISVKNAVNLNGNLDQRTTSVTVTSESDTISLTYNFIFQKQGVPVQPNIAEPFFSEFIQSAHTQGYAIEIYNPGTEELDLSQYCVVRGSATQTWQEAVNTCVNATTAATFAADGVKIYQSHYFPSKRWKNDGTLADWIATPTVDNPYLGKGWLMDDNQTDPWVKSNDVFVMGTGTRDPGVSAYQDKILAESNFIFRGRAKDNTTNAWPGYLIYQQATPCWTRNYLYLLKVTNDSILDGTKNVRDASAYEMIDRFHLIGDSVAGVRLTGTLSLVRKPSVSKGTLERAGGGMETAESSEWIATTTGNPTTNIGLHIMDPRTDYRSTVTSLRLIVSSGYRGEDLTIKGNITSHTPATISLVLDKADSTQVFVFKRGSTVLGADVSLADADLLVVTSGNGKSQTIYKLINMPLNSNTSLTAKAGSGLTVTNNKVTGVTAGMKLKDALAKLVIASTSIMNVYDANGALQSLRVHNLDSLVLDVLVAENLKLEVVAENNDKAVYVFDFNLTNTNAVLMSTFFNINQDNKMIVNLPINLTVSTFLSMVFTNKDATVKVQDKAGFERTYGYMSLDDVAVVTAPDGITQVKYKTSSFISSVFNIYDKSASSVQLYPNPVTNALNIKGIELSTVKVYSLTGMMMISKSDIYNDKIEVGQLPQGIYIIEMTDKSGKIVNDKFLKK